MIKTRKTISLKMISAILAIMMLISVCISTFYEVLAINNIKLVVQTNNNNVISIDETDTKKLNYKIGNIIVGTAKVKEDGSYLTPTIKDRKS